MTIFSVCLLFVVVWLFFFSKFNTGHRKKWVLGNHFVLSKIKEAHYLNDFFGFLQLQRWPTEFPDDSWLLGHKKKKNKIFTKKKRSFFFFYFGFLLDPVIDNESNRVKPVGLNEETRPL